MILWLIRQLLYCRHLVTGDRGPAKLALGCGLGMILGLLPKGNLLALFLAALILSLHLNLGAATLTTLGCSLVSPFFDPLYDRIGVVLLTFDPLSGFWTSLYQVPLAPWTSFNNSVVLGSFVLGSAAFVPVYFTSKACFSRWLDANDEPLGKVGWRGDRVTE